MYQIKELHPSLFAIVRTPGDKFTMVQWMVAWFFQSTTEIVKGLHYVCSLNLGVILEKLVPGFVADPSVTVSGPFLWLLSNQGKDQTIGMDLN